MKIGLNNLSPKKIQCDSYNVPNLPNFEVFFPPEIAIFGQTIGSGGSPKYSRNNISSFLFDLQGYQRGYH
jgi:hypothetical protein